MSNVTRTMDVRIQLRNDLAATWTTVNPVLLRGEMGVEIDTKKFKFGDGITYWNDLPYGTTPAIVMDRVPGAGDYDHPLGTMAIFGTRLFILVNNTTGAAVWHEILNATQIEEIRTYLVNQINSVETLVNELIAEEGVMLKSDFATNDKYDDGYVDQAIRADRLSTPRNINMAGEVLAPAVPFDGTAPITLQAALAEITALAGGGTFTKVVVNSKGIVIDSEVLLPSDIPNLTLTHITDAGTAAGLNTGTAIGQVVVVQPDGAIDPSIMPALSITTVHVVDTQAEMLTVTATQGDVAVVVDDYKTFILATNDPTDAANWKQMKFPDNAVHYVNGHAGPNVTLTTDDIAEGNNNRYFTDARVVTVMGTQASSILTDGAQIVRAGDTLILNGGNAALS